MSTFTQRPVEGDPTHVDLVCTCGTPPERFLATDRAAIAAAKRAHLCRRPTNVHTPAWRPGGGEAA